MLSIDLSIKQGTYEIVFGLSPAVLNHVEEILAHFCLWVASFRIGRSDHGIRLDLEAFAVFLWDPEHFRNHDDRKWIRQDVSDNHMPRGSNPVRHVGGNGLKACGRS